jgi:hypothetical protein
LRIKPTPLVEQSSEPTAVLAVLLDCVLVMNAGDEAFVPIKNRAIAGAS